MSRELHLTRHGETVWHAENRYAGSSDIELSARGRAQAERLAAWAAEAGLARIRSSDLVRARETARIVAARAGLEPEEDARLREVHFGRGEGLTSAEMEREFPDARRAFVAAPASSPLPGGEPGVAAATRMLAALWDAAADGPVLVVAHTTVIRLALCRLLGLPLDAYRERFPTLGNATLTTVRIPDDGDPVGRGALLGFNVPPGSG